MATVSTDPYTTTPSDPIDPKWDPNCPGCLSGIGPDPRFCPGCLSGIGPDPVPYDEPVKYDGGELAKA